MITKMTIATVYVLNQESAYDFYINKLGFRVHTDVPMGPDTRWLTVSPPEQPDLEIVLFPITVSKLFSQEIAETMTQYIKRGTFGGGVFQCNDIYATYQELKSKGVEFIKPPTKEFYATEAVFKDDSGNYFSLQQKPDEQ